LVRNERVELPTTSV